MATRRPSLIVFDVNETLLDIRTLEPLFARLFGSSRTLREWFAQLVLYSEAITLAQIYVPFATIGVGVLRMMGDIHRVAVTDDDIDELQTRTLDMPAHPDVRSGLTRLREAGFVLATLTNSAPGAKGSPMDSAGIADLFDRAFTIDTVRRFKPAPETYRMVANAMAVEPAAMCMVAAHPWDTLGAQAIGCTAAFIARDGNAGLDIPDVPPPDLVAPDLTSLVDEMLRRWPR